MATEDRARQNGRSGFETLRATLTTLGWDPQPTEEEGALRIDFSGEQLPIADALAIVRFDVERFLFYFNFGERAPEARRPDVADLLTRVNWGLVVGNFELDYGSGSVRYKSALDFTEVELGDALIRNAILSAMDTVEHYSPYVLEVIAGTMSPKDAFDQSEAEL